MKKSDTTGKRRVALLQNACILFLSALAAALLVTGVLL